MAHQTNGFQDKIMPVPNPSESYWRSQRHPMDSFRSSEELPAECDVVIIGAGMSGVAVAYHLLHQYRDDEAKPSVTILDARQLCSGATGRNGGHIKLPINWILNYKSLFGVEAAEEIADFVNEQIYAVKSTVEREELECEFELRRSFDVFLDPVEGQAVKKAFVESLQKGEKWTRHVSQVPAAQVEEITSIKGAKAAFSVPVCSLWPYKFVSQLLERISDQINIQMETPVHEVKDDRESGQQVIHTSRGDVRAKKVVFASNAYTAGILPAFKNKIIPRLAHASHLNRDKRFRAPHLGNTYNIKFGPQGTDYLNPRPDGCIVVGGADWTYDDDLHSWFNVWDDSKVSDRPREHFENLMYDYFSGWDKSGAHLDLLWSGIIGSTADSIPYIGQVPGAEGRQYIMAGFNGGGMTTIFLASRGLAKIIKDNVPFSESGIPKLFEVTAERLE